MGRDIRGMRLQPLAQLLARSRTAVVDQPIAERLRFRVDGTLLDDIDLHCMSPYAALAAVCASEMSADSMLDL